MSDHHVRRGEVAIFQCVGQFIRGVGAERVRQLSEFLGAAEAFMDRTSPHPTVSKTLRPLKRVWYRANDAWQHRPEIKARLERLTLALLSRAASTFNIHGEWRSGIVAETLLAAQTISGEPPTQLQTLLAIAIADTLEGEARKLPRVGDGEEYMTLLLATGKLVLRHDSREDKIYFEFQPNGLRPHRHRNLSHNSSIPGL
jgi:hypothetical protein